MVVLGISPGTRAIGIAIWKDGELFFWRMHYFPGNWSDAKLEEICSVIHGWIREHHVTAVAIKIPDELPVSESYIRLVGGLNVLCERAGIRPQYYTLTELKRAYCKHEKANKQQLLDCIVACCPDMYLHYPKGGGSGKRNAEKLFEAAAAARLWYMQSRLPE